MNAKELHDLFASGRAYVACDGERLIDDAVARDADAIATRATGLLAAAEANDGNCPETEAAMCRYTGGEPVTFPKGLSAVVPYSFAANLERERNGLAARVAELEKDAERYRWLRDHARSVEWSRNFPSASFYSTYYRLGPKQMDEEIDAARSKP